MNIKSVKSINPFKSVIQTNYDSMTKWHGGTIEVESLEGFGTTFKIQLSL